MVKFRLIATYILVLLSFSVHADKLPKPSSDVVATIKPMLNSDRVEYFYGSYGIEQLQSCSDIFKGGRVSNLHSIHDNKKIMRTLAFVDFANPMPEPLTSAHQKIQNGESIGIALRNGNWSIIKEPVRFSEVALEPNVLQLMLEESNGKGAVYIYQLKVKNNDYPDSFHYCNIIEIYSPQYLTSEWLKEIYEEDYLQYKSMTPELIEVMNSIRACVSEI